MCSCSHVQLQNDGRLITRDDYWMSEWPIRLLLGEFGLCLFGLFSYDMKVIQHQPFENIELLKKKNSRCFQFSRTLLVLTWDMIDCKLN